MLHVQSCCPANTKTFCFFAHLVDFFLRNRETSAIILVVVIIPFYASRSIKRNNEKKNKNNNNNNNNDKRLHAILRIRIPE